MKRTLKIAIALMILINLIATPITQCVYAVSEGMQNIKDSSQMTAENLTTEEKVGTKQYEDTNMNSNQDEDLVQNAEQSSQIENKEDEAGIDKSAGNTKTEDSETENSEAEDIGTEETESTNSETTENIENEKNNLQNDINNDNMETIEPTENLNTQLDAITETTNGYQAEDIMNMSTYQADDIIDGNINNIENQINSINNERTSQDTLGRLDLEIILRLPTEGNFNVQLQKEGNVITSQGVRQENKQYYYFDNLELGTYTLKVEGTNYITYTQKLEINNEVAKVVLSNGHNINDVLVNGQIKYGVVGLGDITGDGLINETDEKLMIEKIESGVYEERYDLNKDQKIDIIDLSYIVFNKNRNIEATPINMLKLTEENVDLKGTIISAGQVSSIFENNSNFVQLKPKNGQDITENNALEIELNIENNDKKTEAVVITPPTESDNAIQQGEAEITYINEQGIEETTTVQIGSSRIAKVRAENATINLARIYLLNAMINLADIYESEPIKLASLAPVELSNRVTTYGIRAAATATVQKDGSIVIDLGGQIAIKKVTIRVTKTSSNKLAEIAKVEFLNNMETRIPEPEMDIPENFVATPDSEKFILTWKKMTNVTGYEVLITANGKTETVKTSANSMIVSNFAGGKVKNGTTYTVKVQSINGDWRSGYTEERTVTPQPNKVPDAPDNLSVIGAYRTLKASWKNMDSTDSYNIYYREYGIGEYIQVARNIETNSYIITGLKDRTRYQVYVTGNNRIGEGRPSLVSVAETTDVNPPITTNYKLINRPIEGEKKTAHIVSVSNQGGNQPENEFAVVDSDYTTAWTINSWDAGGYNIGKRSPIVEFDKVYKIEKVVVVPSEAQGADYFYGNTQYWDENGNSSIINGQYAKKTSSNGKIYYEFEYNTPIMAKKIQTNFALYLPSSGNLISIAEMKFYEYDGIKDEIASLYTDQLCVTLRDDVTEQTIADIEMRLNTKEEASGEYHPKREMLQKELDTAREILNNKQLKAAIKIDTTVTSAKDSHIGFRGGLNAWQPLGVVGYSGEKIVIYVGNPKLKVEDNTNLQVIATQYHAESGKWHSAVKTLVVGRNEIEVPKIGTLDCESGGSLYINYTGNNAADVYGVRVSGGQEIPVLDLTKVTTEEERKAAVREYVEKLETVVPQLEAKHNEIHKGNEVNSINYDYQRQNCILGATEIVLKTMMYSVSSEQIYSALRGDTIEAKTEQLYNSLVAMEDMIDLFYQHKGLSTDPEAGAKNQYPSSRLNIRYQRMFAGAFMYAGGLHVGIEWGSIGGLATSVPIQSDENGKYISGNYFGWGIAHEIGHIINEGAYAVAEITNNYFSVLAQAKDTNDSVRFKYRNVYDKVTSGTTGKASNVFTQLAMYWQLHLAYDLGGYNYKTYDNYEEQLNNLFFARVDSYARDVSKAPKASENGVALTLNGADTDNKLMRLAVAASERNILEFFEDWGLIPDETTRQYAEQFEKETRRIKFVNDEARAYQLEKKEGFTSDARPTVKIENQIIDDTINDTQIRLKLGLENASQEQLLGYEIYRNGKSIGFVTADETEFIDTINVNNRVYKYEVVAVDKWLNATQKVELNPIKVRHDGSIAKDGFTIITNMTSTEDTKEDEDQNCSGMPSVQAVNKLINKDTTDAYTGTVISTQNAEIVVELNEVLSIIGFKVTKANEGDTLPDYELQISSDKQKWETVKMGTLQFNGRLATVYFDKFETDKDPRVQVFDTSYVKLILKNTTNKDMTITLSELDIIGKPGDNIEILKGNGIGILKEDYILDAEKGTKIPAGSFVVTGEYSGHPAYNVVKLYDEKGELISGSQVIFAQEPQEGQLGNITEGTWIYYIEPEDIEQLNGLPTKVKAELYRVDNALTLEGERLVSDSLEREVPETLPMIEINRGN